MKDSGTEKKWKIPSFNLKFKKEEKSEDSLAEEGYSRSTFRKIWDVIRILCLAVYRLRSVFLAIPVILVALRLAAYNSEHLPLLVGLNLQTTGEFAKTISRQTAVTFPLFLTGGCLVLTFLSKKSLYPWLISIFSLAIPIMLLITNMYPA
jgi:hypothetical protein